MAAPFADHTDVEARWRPLTDDEDAIADQLAIDASDMVRERWADVDDRIAAETLAADSVTRVVAHMAKRAMDRPVPEGFETFNQTAGPFSAGGKVSNPNGNLYFTAADILVFEPEGSVEKVRVGWLA